MKQKAPAGTGVERVALTLIRRNPGASNKLLAELVQYHFKRQGIPCACSASCIGWYKSMRLR